MPTSHLQEPLVLQLRHTPLIEPGDRVLVAVSGGPDSTALLLGLVEAGHEVVVAHYDHALQPGSDQAADHVARLCRSLGIRLLSARRDAPMPKGSVQAGARQLRYEFLLRAAAESGATKIALGHTADDMVEGTVMHLMRGCGIAGMRGMPARRCAFVRPMLDVWRSDVAAFLERRGATALEDPANSNRAYWRVRVRRDLLVDLERDCPGIKARLHSAAMRAAELQAAVESQVEAALGSASSHSALAAMPEPVAAEALRTMFSRAAGVTPALDRKHLNAMLRLLQGGRGGRGVDLPRGLRFRVVGGRAELVPQQAAPSEVSLLSVRCAGCNEPTAVHLKEGLELKVGHRRPGLRMRPAGGAGSRKLQDIFVDARVPREERDRWPLVFAGEKLAWVPGVAVDRDLKAEPGEPSLHVTVTRILSRGSRKTPMLESPDRPPGVPS